MKLAVIGAGWAGCSAAVELTRRGHEVHWFEAARTLGGRARQVTINGLVLDNGQHLLLGAYRATLALLKTLGQQDSLLRMPLQMVYPAGSNGMQLIAAGWPAPLHLLIGLLQTTGLTRADKMALLRFFSAARWMDWQMHHDCSVSELLTRFEQTDNLIRLLWQPLCLAALNTPAQRASAQIFLNVLKHSLGAKRKDCDMLLARTDLSSLLPTPAAAYVKAGGGSVITGCAVKEIIPQQHQWLIRSANASTVFDGVVLATGPQAARALLTPLGLAQHIPDYQMEAITTCYLQYGPQTRLERPFLALLERPADAAFGQFVFDRGQIDDHAGLFAVVISAPDLALEQDHTALATGCARQLATDLQQPELANPLWTQVITEKRATFACPPNLVRPSNELALANLVLAGDYTESRYPATLEAAVQSGLKAASIIVGRISKA